MGKKRGGGGGTPGGTPAGTPTKSSGAGAGSGTPRRSGGGGGGGGHPGAVGGLANFAGKVRGCFAAVPCFSGVCGGICGGLLLLLVTAGMLLFSAGVGYWAVLHAPPGMGSSHTGASSTMHQVHIKTMDLLEVPPAQRDSSWESSMWWVRLLGTMPTYLFGFQGDRAEFFRLAQYWSNVDGHHRPAIFRSTVSRFSHKEVSDLYTSEIQPRGPFLTSDPVPPQCMGNDTLIYVSTGKNHAAVRSMLFSELPGLSAKIDTEEPMELDFGQDDVGFGDPTSKTFAVWARERLTKPVRDDLIQRTIIRTLFKGMFDARLSPEGLEIAMKYLGAGKACVLGPAFHDTLGRLKGVLPAVEKLRHQLVDLIAATPGGKRLYAKAEQMVKEGKMDPYDGVDRGFGTDETAGHAMVRQITDGFAFAGLIGTSHLATHTLQRLRNDPPAYLPLWDKDNNAFLHESARVDPPVASTSDKRTRDTVIEVSSGQDVRSVTIAKDHPVQMAITTANVDPQVFGGEYESAQYARAFVPGRDNAGKSLSWNGILDDVAEFKAPRGCPGYRLSMRVARATVQYFKPDLRDLPEPFPSNDLTAPRSKPLSNETEWDLVPRAPPVQLAGNKESRREFFNHLGSTVYMAFAFIMMGFVIGHEDGHGEAEEEDMSNPPAAAAARARRRKNAGCCFGVCRMWTPFGRLLDRLHSPIVRFFVIFLASNAGLGLCRILDYTYLEQMLFLSSGLAMMSIFTEVWCQDLPSWVSFVISFLTLVVVGFAGLLITLVYWTWFDTTHITMIGPAVNSLGGAAGVLAVLRYAFADGVLAVHRIMALMASVSGVFDAVIFGSMTSPPAPFVWQVTDSLVFLPLLSLVIPRMGRHYPKNVVFPPPKVTMACLSIPSLLAFGLGFLLISSGYSHVQLFDPCRHGHVGRHGAVDNELLAACRESPLGKMDGYGKLMFGFITKKVDINLTKQAQVEDGSAVKVPRMDTTMLKVEAIPGTGWPVPGMNQDEDIEDKADGMVSWVLHLLVDLLSVNTNFFPFQDDVLEWDSPQQALDAIKLMSGAMLPEPATNWANFDVTSDETIAQMAFAGLAAPRTRLLTEEELKTEPDNAVFVCTFGEMGALPVRSNFERYGGNAFFDKDQKVIRIFWSHGGRNVYPGDDEWPHVKYAWRTSVVVGITANEHLGRNHFVYSNLAAMSSREHLGMDHPIRRLLKPFVHRTPTVNYGAYRILTPKLGLLHRTLGFTYYGLVAAQKAALYGGELQGTPLSTKTPELRALVAKEPLNFPYAVDGQALFDVFHNFVKEYCAVYYKDLEAVRADPQLRQFYESMRLLDHLGHESGLPSWDQATYDVLLHGLTQFMFQVSGMHHTVGNVAEYLIDPSFASGRIVHGRSYSDPYSTHYALLVTILTGMKAPFLKNDFTHLLLQDEYLPKTTQIFNDFQTNLTILGDEIDKRNEKRRWPYNGFHPNLLLSSVSI